MPALSWGFPLEKWVQETPAVWNPWGMLSPPSTQQIQLHSRAWRGLSWPRNVFLLFVVQLALLLALLVPADGFEAAVCQNRALSCREMCLLPRGRCCNPQQGSAELLVWSRAAQSSAQGHPGLGGPC